MTDRPEAPRAIGSLATLPVFFKLAGRRVLVAGGTLPAVWKAELLAAAGADVEVAAAEPCAEMVELVAASPDRLTLLRRDWTPADLEGAAIAIGAFEGAGGETFRAAARHAGVPVNVIDVPSLCDFQFGTIVERSPLVIGISTDGAAPILGQALRTRIEALLPARMGEWMKAAKLWREPLGRLSLSFAARQRFWQRFAVMALENEDSAPSEQDRQDCLSAALKEPTGPKGRLILVGVGPGGSGFVTLDAVRALQSADIVFYHPTVAPSVLTLARREASRRAMEGAKIADQPEVTELVTSGKTVAWAMNGDPVDCPNWPKQPPGLSNLEIVRGLRCATCPDGCLPKPSQ